MSGIGRAAHRGFPRVVTGHAGTLITYIPRAFSNKEMCRLWWDHDSQQCCFGLPSSHQLPRFLSPSQALLVV